MATRTVIGFFSDRQTAQRSVEQLQSSGIIQDRINIRSSDSGGSTGDQESVNPVSGSERDENTVRATSEGRTVDRDDRNTNVFTDFFNNLFGDNDDDDKERYNRLSKNTNAVVTVHAQSEQEAETAADILNNAGAMDVDKRTS